MNDNRANVFLTPIEYLKGIGAARASVIKNELGVFSVGDLLNFFPFRYIDRTKYYTVSQITTAQADVQIIGTLGHINEVKQNGRTVRMTATFTDSTGSVELVWFKGFAWIKKAIKIGEKYVVFGRPTLFSGRYNIAHPEMDTLDKHQSSLISALVPVYPSTEKLQKAGITSRVINLAVADALQKASSNIHETLSQDIIQKNRLPTRGDALRCIHFPKDTKELAAARYRMKYEELFYAQLGLMVKKVLRHSKLSGYRFERVGEYFNNFYNHCLPFELTNAQKRVVKEIRKDMGLGTQMNRLVQGDVGSGKTIVALLSMLIALDNGFQACMMAPTEILAQQHFNSISKLLKDTDIRVELLTGSTRASARKGILEGVADGSVKILIGTHALIEDTVVFSSLGLAIIDEQHRFGVAQRSKLWGKSAFAPHILVTTATPIPRTLAMSLYGDLDVSVIDELPKGRKAIKTIHRYDSARLSVLAFLKNEIDNGRQAYIVYPLIEESTALDLKNLMDGFEAIENYFPKPRYQVGIVHGKMKAHDKDLEIKRFAGGQTNVLVATTVIEVGVDIPNASVMVIENAERFGLAQLHQLRGRVGRGAEQSYCILMSSDKLSTDSRKRLNAMVETTDGFKIAEMDLQLRGYGDMMGVRQSGMTAFKIADPVKDVDIMQYAREDAQAILMADPNFLLPANAVIARVYQNMIAGKALWSYIS